MADYPGVPISSKDEERHRIQLAQVVNRTLQGKLNCAGRFALAAGADFTIVQNPLMAPERVVLLDPETASAAAAGAWVAERVTGAFTVRHPASPATDRTFRYVILG